MSKITIDVTEEQSYVPFEATENTVLVPILYATGESEKLPAAKRYESAAVLQSELLNGKHVVYIKDNDTQPDRSYIMAYELLLKGLKVVIKPIAIKDQEREETSGKVLLSEEEIVALLKDGMTDVLKEFENKNGNVYNIKFITTGAYSNCGPNSQLNLADKLLELAYNRGDCVALLDVKEELIEQEELLNELKLVSPGENGRAGAVNYPYCTFTTSAYKNSSTITLSGSFAYLMAYANSVRSNANWFAAAGTVRGMIPNLVEPKAAVGESLMHILQGDEDSNLDVRVNVVYDTGAYGYKMWGNKVACPSAQTSVMKYQDFLNVKLLLCDLKKQIYHSSMRIMFEPNDDIAWFNFKSLNNSLLDQMKSGRGIEYYTWKKVKAVDKATISCILTIKPIEAVESIDVNIQLTDADLTIEEGE